ncbi:MAG: FAD-dependent oxidoreductase [Spirochaetales bacterium]|nr:FAD-dependent oxidoreductase [Spirochaetales bacterium]
MNQRTGKAYDAVIIGGGAAGMAAAVRCAEKGLECAIVDREETLGGILYQCIHNGFGIHEFREELTGPEYAERYVGEIGRRAAVDVFLNSTVVGIDAGTPKKRVIVYSPFYGVLVLTAPAVILCMGCRERNRGNIGTAGTRPSGIFTAGLAQRLINIEGYVPGRNAVIMGSGDIGLIMARRMTWIGAKVSGVTEILPYPSGLSRNISQCLNDFNIPLYLSHLVTGIFGRDRVAGVEVAPLVDGKADHKRAFSIECDTILLSVGLIPENELSKEIGVAINQDTHGPYVDANYMTSVEGVFACGNVLHVHDLVDFVSEESRRCADCVARYLTSEGPPPSQGTVKAGPNVIYVVPNKFHYQKDTILFFRPFIVKNNVMLSVSLNGKVVRTKKLLHVQPSEMVRTILKPADVEKADPGDHNVVEISLR